MVSEHIPSRQLSHGETVSINNVTVLCELDFPQTPTRQTEMCLFPKKEGKGAVLGVGKEVSKA